MNRKKQLLTAFTLILAVMTFSDGRSSFLAHVSGSDSIASTSSIDAFDLNATSASQQPGKDIPPPVLAALQADAMSAKARSAARQKQFDIDRARFEPMANGLADAIRSAGINLDAYLAASKQFVETPSEKITRAQVEDLNKKYAGPIRAAIAKAVGIPGVGALLQEAQSCPTVPSMTGEKAFLPNQPAEHYSNHVSKIYPAIDPGQQGSAGSCCSTVSYKPPFEGLSREVNFGASSTGPGDFYGLSARIRSAIAAAPHDLERSGKRFTVPASARYVRVTDHLQTSWVIGLSGVGYAHVWLGLDMNVYAYAGSARVVCAAPHLEQDNQWTWAGGFLTLSDHRPGPNITRTCEFSRSASDPTDYVTNVSASSDGTFVGFSGGYGDYFVTFGQVDVCTSP